jgi:RNA polymerase sigma-70 factor (ECF subfamily)
MGDVDMLMALEAKTSPRQRFEEIVRRFGPELVRYAYERLGSMEDARDVAQAAMMKAWKAFSEGAEPDSPRAWLYRITYNATIDQSRSRSRRRRAEGIPSPSEPDAMLDTERDETVQAVRSLRSPFGEAITLHFLQGLSIAETAEVLRIPKGTAKSQIARGLELLRSKLSAKPEQGRTLK